MALSISDFASFLQLDQPEMIWEELKGCGSILMIPSNLDENIRFFHTSLRDFFTDSGRSKNYFIDAAEHQLSILEKCILLITDHFTLSDRCKTAVATRPIRLPELVSPYE
jgi:hypothetical protein